MAHSPPVCLFYSTTVFYSASTAFLSFLSVIILPLFAFSLLCFCSPLPPFSHSLSLATSLTHILTTSILANTHPTSHPTPTPIPTQPTTKKERPFIIIMSSSPRSFTFSASSGTPTPTTPTFDIYSYSNASSYYEIMRQWDDDGIATWLHDNKMAHYDNLFVEHCVRGAALLELDHYALKEMGISSLADRIRILAAVKTLRIRCLVVHPLSNGGGSNGYSQYQSSSNKVTFWGLLVLFSGSRSRKTYNANES
ncbi:hypothetical protein BKA57DRAFT_835 [Linnemannia elongata]|nr:hypothetical protein BKA57DRAFT_835 [Linnemannia elongata]